MEDYVPIPMQKRWKDRFFSYHLRHFQDLIINHERKIEVECSSVVTPIFSRLNTATFWKDLKSHSKKKREIEKIHDTWEKIKPLAHLNSKQLLSLLQNEILPLEKIYQQSLKLFEDEKVIVDANHLWPSHWLYPSSGQTITRIKQNQLRLIRLKATVYESLLWRCQAHTLLNSPRNVDDIVGALCSKINDLNLLDQPLDIKLPYSATLDDDRRITIYDCLENSTIDKDDLHDKVLSPIPKQGHKAFKSAAELKKECSDLKKFYSDTFESLTVDNGTYSFIPSSVKKFVPTAVTNASKNILNATKDIFSDIGLLSFILKLWNLRYIAYLALTFISYHYLIVVLQPVVSLLLGAAAFSVFDSILFYSLALSPVWALGWILLTSLKQGVVNYLTHWKKGEIYQALDNLISTQEFIANRLSQVISDIPHFDIQQLTENAQQHIAQLNQARAKLNRFYFTERFFCRGNVSQKNDLVKSRIDTQQSQLMSHLKQLATHIASRVGDDIELLEKSVSKEKLTPIIPHQQFEKLKKFVVTYGDKKALQQFEQNANPIFKWMSKIERCSRVQNQVDIALAQPWGGHAVRDDYIKGWEIILNAYVAKGAKQEAALQIINLLSGKIHPTLQQLKEWINQLEVGDKAQQILQNIQTHVFNTLKPHAPLNARLLSTQHKMLVSQWYEQHKEEINRAEKEIRQIFNTKRDDRLVQQLDSFGDDTLSNIYELLDGADIYSYSSKQSTRDNERKNLARQYFKNYKGESSRAFRFLRFIPEDEIEAQLIDVAKKRLTWLLEQLELDLDPAKAFDETDTELFHDYRLIEASEKFDFTSFISQSKQFSNTWNPKIESFLDACRRNGFDTGKLSKNYKEKNHHIKPFILTQLEQQKKSTSCHLEEKKLNSSLSDVTNKRRIYVKN